MFSPMLLDLLTTQDPDVFTRAVQYFPMHGIDSDLGAGKLE